MEERYCSNCQYFLQHYTLDESRIFRVYCGHCTLNRTKRRRPDAKACDGFIPGLPKESFFVSKEYLSKELLQYVLGLELLPEIEEKERD